MCYFPVQFLVEWRYLVFGLPGERLDVAQPSPHSQLSKDICPAGSIKEIQKVSDGLARWCLFWFISQEFLVLILFFFCLLPAQASKVARIAEVPEDAFRKSSRIFKKSAEVAKRSQSLTAASQQYPASLVLSGTHDACSSMFTSTHPEFRFNFF